MRVSELSERADVPLPTIKYYIREGLLPAGAHTAPNQAEYSEAHLERLDLIRALRETAGFSLAAIKEVVEAMEGRGGDPGTAVGIGVDLIGRAREPLDRASAEYAEARALVLGIVAEMGWGLGEGEASLQDAIRAYMTVGRLWRLPLDVEGQLVYGHAAQRIAEVEIPDDWNPPSAPEESVRYAVLGTLLFEPVILALRRAANTSRARALGASRGNPQTRSGKSKG